MDLKVQSTAVQKTDVPLTVKPHLLGGSLIFQRSLCRTVSGVTSRTERFPSTAENLKDQEALGALKVAPLWDQGKRGADLMVVPLCHEEMFYSTLYRWGTSHSMRARNTSVKQHYH